MRIGNIGAVEQNLETLVAIELQGAVSGLTADHELYRARHIHYRDVVTIGLHCNARNRAGHHRRLAAKIDIDDLVPLGVLNIVVIGRVVLVGHGHIGRFI